MAAGENRQYGGNSGYDDQADVFYSWDSTVKNHAEIAVGDRVAIWDKVRLLGVSVVEEIETKDATKVRSRCPSCSRTNIGERTTKTPRYKCQKCGSEFDEPTLDPVKVKEYKARHDAAWTSLEGLLSGPQLRSLCFSPASQHSMRSLDWSALSSALVTAGETRAVSRIVHRAPEIITPNQQVEYTPLASGHAQAVVRVRRGQQQFRERILARFGEHCAFTGPTPKRVLDAGHLYSYADLGEHHEHGGLMLRRDIHRLFDDGGLAVNPSTRRIDVSETLAPYAQYTRLQDKPLQVDINDQHAEWLEKHWEEHRS